MLKSLREAVKRVPWLGPALYHAYLVALYQEGRKERIRGGILEGMWFRRFMRTFNEAYLVGDYEAELQDAFASYLKPGNVVYDVGANVGFMTLVAAKLVGPAGAVISFEPSRDTARQLAAQIEVNGLGNVTVKNCAVSDREGMTRLVTDVPSVMARLVAIGSSDGHSGHSEEVATTTLDKVSTEHPAPDLLKIDVEGAELMVLRGASRLLRDRRPVILIELHSEDLSRQFHRLMQDVHYKVMLPDGGEAEPGSHSRFVVAVPASA